MTINLTALLSESIVQVSDRQISMKGEPFAEWNKAVVFNSNVMRLAVTFTGVAQDVEGDGPPGSRNTDMLIADALADERLGDAEFDDVLAALAAGLSKRFTKVALDKRHTIVTLAGWRTDDPRPLLGQVENCLDADFQLTPTARTNFDVRSLPHSQLLHKAGAIKSLDRVELRVIDRFVRSEKSVERVTEAMVSTVRSAAMRAKTVNGQCMSIAIHKGVERADACFHQDGTAPVMFGPTVVMCHPPDRGVLILGGAVGVGDLPPGMKFTVGDVRAGRGVTVDQRNRPSN